MKRLFMTFAAMLLVSVSAMAQSGNNEPLKGDGTVDVARINKNVEEHYFYLGTIKPTAENYKIIPGSVTSYTFIDQAMGTTASVEAGQTLYLLCPAEWIARINVVVEDNSGETISFSEDIDDTTISGYVIRKTQVWNEPSTITLKIYNYFIGVVPITPIIKTDYSLSDLNEYMESRPTTLITSDLIPDEIMTIWIYPESWGKPTSMMYLGIESKGGFIWDDPTITSKPEGYYVVTCYGNAATYTVTWPGTGISLTPALSKGEEAIYNVSGQRMSKPQKGIYIKDGKKFVK